MDDTLLPAFKKQQARISTPRGIQTTILMNGTHDFDCLAWLGWTVSNLPQNFVSWMILSTGKGQKENIFRTVMGLVELNFFCGLGHG